MFKRLRRIRNDFLDLIGPMYADGLHDMYYRERIGPNTELFTREIHRCHVEQAMGGQDLSNIEIRLMLVPDTFYISCLTTTIPNVVEFIGLERISERNRCIVARLGTDDGTDFSIKIEATIGLQE